MKFQLEKAFDIYCYNLCKTLPSEKELEKVSFSLSFEKKMEKLILKQRQFWFYTLNTFAKKAAVITIIPIIVLILTLTAIPKFRNSALDFAYKTYTGIFLDSFFENEGNVEDYEEKIIITPAKPSYIPKDFTIIEEVNSDYLVKLVYSNGEGENICYTQTIKDSNLLEEYKKIDYKKVSIGKQKGIMFTLDSQVNVIFYDMDYIYSLSGKVSKETLLKIANSILE